METHLKALLIALILLALYAAPVAAQGSSITIEVDCGSEESVTVTNDTAETLTLEGVNSSAGMEGNPEIDLNLEIDADSTETTDFGDISGSGNIFANGEGEDAIVFISGQSYIVNCGEEDFGSETFNVGTPPVEATKEPIVRPTEVVETEETPTPEATKETPEMPGKAGGGGLATGASVPWGSLGLAASGLLAAGYAVLRRR